MCAYTSPAELEPLCRARGHGGVHTPALWDGLGEGPQPSKRVVRVRRGNRPPGLSGPSLSGIFPGRTAILRRCRCYWRASRSKAVI